MRAGGDGAGRHPAVPEGRTHPGPGEEIGKVFQTILSRGGFGNGTTSDSRRQELERPVAGGIGGRIWTTMQAANVISRSTRPGLAG